MSSEQRVGKTVSCTYFASQEDPQAIKRNDRHVSSGQVYVSIESMYAGASDRTDRIAPGWDELVEPIVEKHARALVKELAEAVGKVS